MNDEPSYQMKIMKPKSHAKPTPMTPAQRREHERKQFKERMEAEKRGRKQ